MIRATRYFSTKRFFFCLLIGLFCSALVFVSISKPSADAKGPGRTARQGPKQPAPHSRSNQTIFAPTIDLKDSSGAELALNNNGPEKIEVKTTFYTSEGNPVQGRPVSLNPVEVRHVNLEQLLPSERNGQKWGGMSLDYFGGTLEVVAQLTLFRQGRAGSVDIPFSARADYLSIAQEAVWWMPANGTATLVLGNASDSGISVSVEFSNGETQTVSLAPHATELVEYRDKGQPGPPQSGALSARLNINGPIGSLRATGFAASADRKFSSAIRFYDLQTIRQPHLFATNLRVKNSTLQRRLLVDCYHHQRERRPRKIRSGDQFQWRKVLHQSTGAGDRRDGDLRSEKAAR
jgi:hypothetical protein